MGRWNGPVAAGLMALAPSMAAAQAGGLGENGFTLSCSFTTVCREAEPCAATRFDLDVSGRAGGMGAGAMLAKATLSSRAGKVEAFGPRDGDTLFLQGGSRTTHHYLLVSGTDARYTLHMAEGPMMVGYIGTCE